MGGFQFFLKQGCCLPIKKNSMMLASASSGEAAGSVASILLGKKSNEKSTELAQLISAWKAVEEAIFQLPQGMLVGSS